MTLVDSDDGQRELEARQQHSVCKAKPWHEAPSCEENFALNMARLFMYGAERVAEGTCDLLDRTLMDLRRS